MAHKKASGSTRLGRDSAAQRLGVKIYGDQYAVAGNIILRQHGCLYHPGENVMKGTDDTLHALVTGKVHFQKVMRRRFTGALRPVRIVSVIPAN